MLLHPTLHFYIWHKLLVTKTVASMVKRKSSTSCFYVFTLPPPLPLCGCVYICERAGQAECVHCTLTPAPRVAPGPARRVRRSPGGWGEETSVQPWPGPEWHPECDMRQSRQWHTHYTEINIVIKSQWKDRVASKKKQQQWKIVLCFAVFHPKSSVLEMIRVQ